MIIKLIVLPDSFFVDIDNDLKYEPQLFSHCNAGLFFWLPILIPVRTFRFFIIKTKFFRPFFCRISGDYSILSIFHNISNTSLRLCDNRRISGHGF